MKPVRINYSNRYYSYKGLKNGKEDASYIVFEGQIHNQEIKDSTACAIVAQSFREASDLLEYGGLIKFFEKDGSLHYKIMVPISRVEVKGEYTAPITTLQRKDSKREVTIDLSTIAQQDDDIIIKVSDSLFVVDIRKIPDNS